MPESHISQRGASSGHLKHEATGECGVKPSIIYLEKSDTGGTLSLGGFQDGTLQGHGFLHPMTGEKHQGSHAEIMHFCTTLFCINCDLVMGYNNQNLKNNVLPCGCIKFKFNFKIIFNRYYTRTKRGNMRPKMVSVIITIARSRSLRVVH